MTRNKAVVLLGLLMATAAAASELKVGYVDTQRIVRDAPAAIRAARKLDQEFGRRDQELQRLAAELQSRQESLAAKRMTLSPSEQQAGEREIGELARDLRRQQRQFQEDLNQRQNEENVALIEKANTAIKEIAETENFDLILQDALWIGQGLDITGQVIKFLTDGK